MWDSRHEQVVCPDLGLMPALIPAILLRARRVSRPAPFVIVGSEASAGERVTLAYA